jgi:hypothetical protein
MSVFACDLDGVVCDFTGLFNYYMLKEHGLPVAPPVAWNWFSDAHGAAGKLAYKTFMEDPTVIAEWWPQIEPIPGAIKTLESISDADNGVEIIFVTHRRSVLQDVTREWLDRHGLWMKVIHAGNEKHAHIDADFWLDDNVDVIKGLREEEHKNAYLFDQPWNRDVKLARLTGWNEVADAIEWCL